MGASQSTDGEFANIPGVMTSEQWENGVVEAIHSNSDAPWLGSLSSLISQTMPDRFKLAFDARDPENAAPSPEVKPYTFWERVGAMPVNVGRLRPRQYYYPCTDFRDWTYDEASPEESQLRARWLSRMFDVSWHWPVIYFSSSFIFCLPLPATYRTPGRVCCALTSVLAEGMRVYINAGAEREALDDFIVAKEFWYMKNVEALELGLVSKPQVSETEYERRRMEAIFREARESRHAGMFAKPENAPPLPDGLQGASRATYEQLHK